MVWYFVDVTMRDGETRTFRTRRLAQAMRLAEMARSQKLVAVMGAIA